MSRVISVINNFRFLMEQERFLLVVLILGFMGRFSSGTKCGSQQFSCGSGECIPKLWKCDSEEDCRDGSDELECAPLTCNDKEFKCKNKCIPLRWVCDGENDCGDNPNGTPSDELEKNCPHCAGFKCSSKVGAKQCIPLSWKCDGQDDCLNGEDEVGCTKHTCAADEFACANGKCITRRFQCDQDDDCGDNSDEAGCPPKKCASHEFQCVQLHGCIPINWRCDTDRDCSDSSDEANCNKTIPGNSCSSIEFKCANDDCIHISWRCDGDSDCMDGSDEQNCTKHCPGEEWRCKSGG